MVLTSTQYTGILVPMDQDDQDAQTLSITSNNIKESWHESPLVYSNGQIPYGFDVFSSC